MTRKALLLTGLLIILAAHIADKPLAGPPLIKCSPQPQCLPGPRGPSDPSPTCGIEITCTDKPVQLGYSDGVCFRATCPGIWAMLHKRVDQASFRRRIWTYRHFAFKGYWELKDRGAIESGPAEIRELFLVMPDDLIEFRLRDPDPCARVEFRNIGYLKRGAICELRQWLARNTFMEMPNLQRLQEKRAASSNRSDAPCSNRWIGWCRGTLLSNVFSLGRALLPPFAR